MRNIISLFIFILFFHFSFYCYGYEVTYIESHFLDWRPNEGIYYFKGKVKIKRLDIIIKAESVKYWPEKEIVIAEGNVKYSDSEVIVKADSVKLNLKTQEGELYKTHIFYKKENYHIYANKVKKIGKKDYIVYKTTFTTCDAPIYKVPKQNTYSKLAWCFVTNEAFIKSEKSISAKNVTFRIKGIPILYSPYILAPLSSERKTGFLIPKIGFDSKKGIQWRQPFYLVISKNRDATFYIDIFSKRGIAEALEYRYIEKNIGKGRWWLYHLRDWHLNKNFLEFKGGHRIYKGNKIKGFINLNLINRKEFYRQYSHKVEVRLDRYLESSAEFYHPFTKGKIYLQMRFWQDIQKDSKTGTSYIVQRLPEIGFILYPIKKDNFYFTFYTKANNFYTEKLFRVKRLDISPSIYYSYGDSIRFIQKLSLKENIYHISHSDIYPVFTNKESLLYRAKIHTMFNKRYKNIMHIVEPEIGYMFILSNKKNLPLLDNTELLTDTSIIDAGIRSYIYNKGKAITSFRITSNYNLLTNTFDNIKLEGVLYTPIRLQLDTSYNIKDKVFKHINYQINPIIKGLNISIGQRYSKEKEILFYTGTLDFSLTHSLSLSSAIWYDAKGEGLIDLKISTKYSSQCWSAKMTFSKRPDDYGIFFIVRLKGLGELKLGGL